MIPCTRGCRVVNDTHYNPATPQRVIDLIESFRGYDHNPRERLRFTFGSDWVQSGYVGRSTGRCKIPLIINNARSFGGGPLDAQHLTRIEYANKGYGTKYAPRNHPLWQAPESV